MSLALDGLPNEIISAIFAHLNGEVATLLAICRVSRYFYSLITPTLYRVIQHLHKDGPHDRRRNPLLLRSLLRNPALGSHVVEVQLTAPAPLNKVRVFSEEDWAEEFEQRMAPTRRYEDVSCFSEEEWVLVRARVARLFETGLFTEELYLKSILNPTDLRDGVGSEECWDKNIREGQWDAVFCLMLYCCPRLEKLRGFQWDRWDGVGPLYPRFNLFAFFMSGVALSKAPERLHAQKPGPVPVPILPHYRDAHLSHNTRGSGRPILLQSLLPFLFSPAIELFRVDPNIEGAGTQRHRFWGDRQFFFKKLVLKQSKVAAETLRYLLNSCGVLEEFVLEYGVEDDVYNMFGNTQRMVYDQGPLPGGLLRSKKSLTRLELARGFPSLYNRDRPQIDQTLGSLVEFEVLTHLAVKLEFLISNGKPDSESSLCGIMPRSLEFLSIATEDVPPLAELRHFEGTVSRKEVSLLRNMQHFEELLLKKESTVPNLRHLDLDGIQRETADSSALTALKWACMTSNVQLSIVLYHTYFKGPGERVIGSERVRF